MADPALIPRKLESGCPDTTTEYGNTCCCGNSCCWDNCRWHEPPECALQEEDAEWKWDNQKQMFIAQCKYRRVLKYMVAKIGLQ